MKKLNTILFALLVSVGAILSSCQKDDALNQKNPTPGDLKVVTINCEECLDEWADSHVTYGPGYFTPQSPNVAPPTNIYLDVHQDATTIYYRLYRLNGETFVHLNINGTVVMTYGATPVTEYSWSAPLPADWAACDVITTNLIVGGLNIHNAHFNACIEYSLRELCGEWQCSGSETGWANGPRYTQKGNWATYTPYVANSTVIIYAGQNINVGTVQMSAVVNNEVTLTIELTGGWHFQDVNESLKIQDYAVAPSGNPAPGQFAWKYNATGDSWTVTVPANNFYGIHLDLTHCVWVTE